eukprot:scpid99709/ scgid12641/ 
MMYTEAMQGNHGRRVSCLQLDYSVSHHESQYYCIFAASVASAMHDVTSDSEWLENYCQNMPVCGKRRAQSVVGNVITMITNGCRSSQSLRFTAITVQGERYRPYPSTPYRLGPRIKEAISSGGFSSKSKSFGYLNNANCKALYNEMRMVIVSF